MSGNLKENFIANANKVHNFGYDYTSVNYTNNKTKSECYKNIWDCGSVVINK